MFRLYFKIWLRLTLSSFQVAFVSRFGAIIFVIAKLLRFTFFFMTVVLLVSKTKTFVGYTLIQSLIFFLTFNIIDDLSQLLFREVYRFRPRIISGDFDLVLTKPVNPLFQVLLGGADPLDLIVVIPYVFLLLLLIGQISFTYIQVIIYLMLVLNGFLIAAAFHILVLALGIITTEIDHAIMIYRDITGMARFPVDIYKEPLRGLITFIIPIGVMMTFPAKALFGLLTPMFIIISFTIGLIFFYLSIMLWNYALSQYASASS